MRFLLSAETWVTMYYAVLTMLANWYYDLSDWCERKAVWFDFRQSSAESYFLVRGVNWRSVWALLWCSRVYVALAGPVGLGLSLLLFIYAEAINEFIDIIAGRFGPVAAAYILWSLVGVVSIVTVNVAYRGVRRLFIG